MKNSNIYIFLNKSNCETVSNNLIHRHVSNLLVNPTRDYLSSTPQGSDFHKLTQQTPKDLLSVSVRHLRTDNINEWLLVPAWKALSNKPETPTSVSEFKDY